MVNRRGTVGVVGFTLALGLAASGVATAACSPNLPEACDEAVACGATMDDFNDPHFQVEFLSRSYDPVADETTFVYLICRLLQSPDLSHWVLGLCSDLRARVVDFDGGTADSGLVAPDPTTCLDGLKFDTSGGVPTCDDTCPLGSGSGGVFSVTLSGNVPTAIVPGGVTIATKAGQVTDSICLEGPSCNPVTTTTTSSSTSTSTSSSTSSSSSSSSSSTTSTSSSTSTTTDDTLETTTTLETTSTTVETSTTSSTSTSSSSSSSTTSSTVVTTTTTSVTTTTVQCLTDPACADGDVCTDDVCDDGVCVHIPLPPAGSEAICNDMADDDCDGVVDCDDPDCAGIDECPPIKKDPSKIIFGEAGGLDQFKSHGRAEPGEPIDVGSVEVGWMLSGPSGHIYRAALIPGDFQANVKNTTFRFVDRGAREGRGKRFGIYKAKVRISRGGTSYGYKIQAYGDLSLATTPDMALQFYIGDRIFIHDEPWQRTSYGWKATSFE